VLLKLPDRLRDQVAQWLAPEAAKPNGRDHDPPPIAPMGRPRMQARRRGKAELAGVRGAYMLSKRTDI
jgi:hypothetical protein